MLRNRRVIAIIPAGRRRYLQILDLGIRCNLSSLDEVHLWVNTNDADDLLYLRHLASLYPEFYRVVESPSESIGIYALQNFYRLGYSAADVVYIKIDDDICYLHPNAIDALVNFRIDHPEYLIVSGNVVNCSMPDFLSGRATRACPEITDGAICGLSWTQPEIPERIHSEFLRDIEVGNVQRHMNFLPFETDEQFSINFVAWLGEGFREIARLIGDNDEYSLCCEIPRRTGRKNVIIPDAVVAHFAFYPQREYLEKTDLLEAYSSFAPIL